MPRTDYRVDGHKVPSVTTILGKFKDPGALMYWSWQCANGPLEEAVNLLNRISKSGYGGTLTKATDAYLRSDPLTRANFRDHSERAMSAGTLAHDLVEQYISSPEKFTVPTVKKLKDLSKCTTDTAEKSLSALTAFLDWVKHSKCKLIASELKLISEEHRYGGTIDALGRLGHDLVLIDWKAAKGLYADYLIQLAAYWMLADENKGRHPFSGRDVQSAHLLRFDKETADFNHHSFTDLEEGKEMFLLFRRCYDLETLLKKRMK